MLSYCRLCAEPKKKSDLRKTVYDWGIKEKLIACCNWNPSNNEYQIPHTVCNECVDQLENCWQFVMRISESEQKLLQIVHFSSNELEFPEESKPGHEFIEIKAPADGQAEEEDEEQEEEEEEEESSESASASETDSEQSNHVKRSTRKPQRSKKKRKGSKLCSILRILSKDDCNPDGTVNDNGLSKIELYLSEIETKTWNDCHFKCNDCNYNAKGYKKFLVHDQTSHSPFLMKKSFQCPFCVQECKRLQSLVVHISFRHLDHLSYW